MTNYFDFPATAVPFQLKANANNISNDFLTSVTTNTAVIPALQPGEFLYYVSSGLGGILNLVPPQGYAIDTSLGNCSPLPYDKLLYVWCVRTSGGPLKLYGTLLN